MPQLVDARAGNGVRDMSDDTIVAMPCVSSRPRTTSASICDGVRKMTIRSVMSRIGMHQTAIRLGRDERR